MHAVHLSSFDLKHCRVFSHLGAWHGPLLVPPPVEILHISPPACCVCVKRLLRCGDTHHQHLSAVERLAHNESIILQVGDHWHQCCTAAAPPPPLLPLQGSSQQSGARCERDGGSSGPPVCRTTASRRSFRLKAARESHWPGRRSTIKIRLEPDVHIRFVQKHTPDLSIWH